MMKLGTDDWDNDNDNDDNDNILFDYNVQI